MKTTWKNIDKITNKKRRNNEETIRNNFKKSILKLDEITNKSNDNFKKKL